MFAGGDDRRLCDERLHSAVRSPGRNRGIARRMQHDGRGGQRRREARRQDRTKSEKMMESFTVLQGLVAPLDRANVDTDQIIPKQFLKSIKRTGFGVNLFDAWRYLDARQPARSDTGRPLNPDFVLNQPRYQGASILLARKNFGCGSSREHAPWALAEYGFRALIAPSYADIFFNNCFKNGLLPIRLPETEIAKLFDEAAAFVGFRLVVDLERQTVASTDQSLSMRFEIDPFRKHCLLNGLDEIGLTLRHADKIREFEARRKTQYPWYF